ncbi:hypothetical protein C84B14_12393 [Salinisphaera sp. C84B14]|uniref:sulfatase n=1 Tax=Salinisphaera sp. C84B14 TaxID=1304155 RepID=UPI003342BA12
MELNALPGFRFAPVAGAVVALLTLYALAIVPGLPGGDWRWAAIEPALLLAALLLLARVQDRALRALVTLVFAGVLTLTLADWATGLAFGRPFNLARDSQLPGFGWNVFSQAIGPWPAAVALIAVAGVLLLLLALLFHALGAWTQARGPQRRVLAAVLGVYVAVSLIIAWLGPHGPTPVYDRLAMHVEQFQNRHADTARFEAGLRGSPTPGETTLAGLAGKDVLFVFVESYGRTLFERALYADTVKSRLADFERRIGEAGFTARSGWLTAPTVGGQSWLAHATLLSGLWIDSQPRYEALIASDRVSLNRRFGQAGWRTAAVMPAITRDWPEAAWFGYDRVYASDDLGYEGEPFNWVTMPDQYTLTALQRAELDPAGEQPVMIEAALISSHAPWVPIPPLLDWATIGDGQVFDDYARAGDPPVEVWKDPDRVRAQYLKAIDYSLATLASFVGERAHDDLVLVILGDHQPAPIITGPEASRDVPIHILSTDPSVLAAIDSWQWQTGMTPGATAPALRMDAFYERFLSAFAGGAERTSPPAELPAPAE